MRTIKYVIVTMVFVFGLSTSSFAGQKYNPYTGQWESVGSDYNLKYNPYSNSYNYQKPSSRLIYNPYTGQWEYER